MATQVSLLDGALASAGTLAIQTNGTTSAITISSAQVATFVNNPIMTGLTASRAVFTDGSKGLTSNAITGTGNVVMSASPTLTGTIDGAALTLSSNLTLSGGTANGVLYLNGSKVATSGSALTFNGTNFSNTSGYVSANTDFRIAGSSFSRVAIGDGGGGFVGGYNITYSGGPVYDSTGAISGIYNGSDGAVKFYAGGSAAAGTAAPEAMRLTSTGLGIGTSSPADILHISKAGDLYLRVANTSTGINAYFGQDSNGTYIGNTGASVVRFIQGSSERARIDSSGNLGIGTTSPNSLLTVQNGNILLRSAVTTGALSSYNLGFSATATGGAAAYITSYRENANEASALVFGTWNGSASAERARIDSSGVFLVGDTSAITNVVGIQATTATSARWPIGCKSVDRGLLVRQTDANGGIAAYFEVNNGTNVGSINTTATATSYATSSDYRLKENIQPMQNALGVVAQLKPVTYTWKADGSEGQGFIAHELQAVVPDCVTGEKDAVDADGKPIYQGIDTSFLVATLTAALQEAVAEINSLKARLDAANL